MHRTILLTLAWLAAPGPDARAEGAPAGFATWAWAITDTVLDHHISPPTRQQMILDGLHAVYKAAGTAEPAGLARKVSLTTGVESFAALLDQAWSRQSQPSDQPARKPSSRRCLRWWPPHDVPGGARFISAKELKVQQQIEGNHYVGLQIALGFNNDAKRPELAQVFEGGPAHRAGVLKGDLIEEIDGVTTDGLELREVIDRLRGLEGTDVSIRVRQGKAAEARTYKITRGVLPRQTIEGIRSFGGRGGDVLVNGPGLISYLKFKEIAGSTPQELRQLARTLEDEGAKALVLDLRGLSQAAMHPTVLLADELLDGGTIGRVRTADRVEIYKAEPDALFRDWPLVLLVESSTPGAAEWLAAALQDNHRAVIVGRDPRAPRAFGTNGLTGIETAVPFADRSLSVVMVTGLFERGDGRPLAVPPSLVNAERQRRPGTKVDPAEEEGFVPDVLIELPPTARLGGPRPKAAPENDRNVANDAFLAAALQRLRTALNLPPLGPKPKVYGPITAR